MVRPVSSILPWIQMTSLVQWVFKITILAWSCNTLWIQERFIPDLNLSIILLSLNYHAPIQYLDVVVLSSWAWPGLKEWGGHKWKFFGYALYKNMAIPSYKSRILRTHRACWHWCWSIIFNNFFENLLLPPPPFIFSTILKKSRAPSSQKVKGQLPPPSRYHATDCNVGIVLIIDITSHVMFTWCAFHLNCTPKVRQGICTVCRNLCQPHWPMPITK